MSRAALRVASRRSASSNPSASAMGPYALWHQRVEPAAFWVLMGLLLWAPLPLGSNRPWAAALLAMVLWLLLAAVAVGWLLRQPRKLPTALRQAAWPVAGLLAYALLLVVQLGAPQGAVPALRSVDPFATQQYLMATLSYLAAFVLVLQLANSERRVRQLLGTLVAGGTLQAVLAVALYAGRDSYEFMGMSFTPGGRVSGTFANWNHLAGYMELCLSAGLALMLASMRPGSPAITFQQRLRAVLQFVLSSKMLVRLLLVTMVIALVMSRSRMGNIAFFTGLLITGAVCAVKSPLMRRAALWLMASLLVVDIIVVGQWVGLEKVVQRLDATAVERDTSAAGLAAVGQFQRKEESLQERLQAARDSLVMVQQRPWLGFGGGSYHTAFTPYKSEFVKKFFFDHTHDDYVEVAADTGLVGLALLLAVVLISQRRAWQGIGDHRPAYVRGTSVGVFMAICCLALHSLVDFNLQIPSNALTFTVLLALVWCLPRTGSSRGRRASAERAA